MTSADWFVQYNAALGDRVRKEIDSFVLLPQSNAPNYRLKEFSAEFQKLHDDIQSFYTNDELDFKAETMHSIQRIAAQQSTFGLRDASIYLTGSSVTFLAAENSDADYCILVPHNSSSELDKLECLRTIRNALRQDKAFNDTLLSAQLIEASIPLLQIKLEHNGKLYEADISCTDDRRGFVSGLYNSHLLQQAFYFDTRFTFLAFFVKQFAVKTGLYSPTTGHFNSYCLALMVMHFLQCGVSPPILPNLKHMFPGVFAESETNFPSVVDFSENKLTNAEQSLNDLNLGQLFYGFLVYYANFDYDSCSIMMAEGRVINLRINDSCMCMQDPFDSHNPARTLFEKGRDQTIKVAQAYTEAIKCLLRRNAPVTVDILLNNDAE